MADNSQGGIHWILANCGKEPTGWVKQMLDSLKWKKPPPKKK